MEKTGGKREALLVASVTFVLYAVYEIRRHQIFETSAYDLGIFDQGIRSYSEFHWPTAQLRAPESLHGAGFPLLGDHFSPVLAVLGVVYRVLPYVEVVLAAQALLIAWSAYVFTAAVTEFLGHHGRGVVLGLGGAYAFSWGITRMAGFDFHEVAFALPLLCLAMRAFLRERWISCAWWAMALLLVKEDLGFTVLFFGLLLLPRGRNRRAGVILCVSGPLFAVLAVTILVPHFNPGHVYGYLGAEPTDGSGLSGLAKSPWRLPVDLFYPWTKTLTLFFLLLPTAFLAMRSRLLLLAVPVVVLRFVADNTYYWGTKYHYSATLMPVVFFALVDVLRRHPELLDDVVRPQLRQRIGRIGRISRIGVRAPVTIALVLLPAFGFGELVAPHFWDPGSRVAAADGAIAAVPRGVLVAAADDLAPHLTDQDTVYLPKPEMFDPGQPPIDWIIADTTAQGFKHQDAKVAVEAQALGYRVVYSAGGYVVLQRQ